MARAHPTPDFGEIDLDLEIDREPPSPPADFGTVEWEPDDALAAAHPASCVVRADGGEERPRPVLRRIDSTATMQASVDEGLMALARGDDEPESCVTPKDDRVAMMRELYARGEADAALQLATSFSQAPPSELDDPFGGLVPVEDEEPVEVAPSYHPAAAALSLTQRQGIPRIIRTPAEIAKLPIDHRGGFLLAFVDGNQTLEEILDICAMPANEALEIIEQLQMLDVIVFE